jgi:hypothetical protein
MTLASLFVRRVWHGLDEGRELAVSAVIVQAIESVCALGLERRIAVAPGRVRVRNAANQVAARGLARAHVDGAQRASPRALAYTAHPIRRGSPVDTLALLASIAVPHA